MTSAGPVRVDLASSPAAEGHLLTCEAELRRLHGQSDRASGRVPPEPGSSWVLLNTVKGSTEHPGASTGLNEGRNS